MSLPTVEHLKVPTGDILIVEGEKGKLELLSIGDYGKDVNLKCKAMGLTREISKVEHQKMLPLEEKWVVTISTQYGCSMGCTFCDVPKVGPGKNASHLDMMGQVESAMAIHPEVTYSDRLNIHYARMGEPTWNPAVITSAFALSNSVFFSSFMIHPVVSTMMPCKNKNLADFITRWMTVKNKIYQGNAGLQISVNSTNEQERAKMFNNNALDLKSIGELMQPHNPVGRKITLNFAVVDDYEIDPDVLLDAGFDPERFIIKLTPMHKTDTALANDLETSGDYTTSQPYQEHEERLIAAGYDVLVFVASEAEDLGRITCGNAILSGTKPLNILS